MGIGAFYPEATSSLVTAGYVTLQDLVEFRTAGVVGDMVLRFFDREGRECSTSLAARTLSVELGDYRRIPKKIAVAGGLHKAVAVQAALHGGLVDVLPEAAADMVKMAKTYQMNPRAGDTKALESNIKERYL